jgi:hypothetical protein
MIGVPGACGRGRAWPSRSRTQDEEFAGGKGESEDAEMRGARHVIRVRANRTPII